jgi:hypothetical protein
MNNCTLLALVSSVQAEMLKTLVPSVPADTRSLAVVPSALTNVTSAQFEVRTKIGAVLAAMVLPYLKFW